MRINLVGAFIRNKPFGTEIAFAKGFDRLGGHQVSLIDPDYDNQPWDYGADATVVFKWLEGETNLANLSACSGKKIVYQPDDIRFPHIQTMMRTMRESRNCEFAFTFDNDGAEMARRLGYRRAERLLLTADDELYRPLPGSHVTEKDIDVCFIGSLSMGENHRSRVRMCQLLSRIQGLKTCFRTDVYDIEEIVRIYNRSKVVLNHATDVGQTFGHGYGYQCRHFEAGFTAACVLSNKVDNEREILNVNEFASEAELVGKLRYLIENPEYRVASASALYLELMGSHRPENRAAQMIQFIERL